MATESWNIVSGGLAFADDLQRNPTRPPRGIFGEVPGATPKYARNVGVVWDDFRETMARMFMPVQSYKNLLTEYANKQDLLQIATVLGGEVSVDGSTFGGAGYMDFLLQGVQHSFQEKMQVVEVLADEHVAYYFGQAASTFAYSGTLFNTKQDDQALNMLRLYSEFGRGSKLAARNTLISIRYDGIIVSGALSNFTYSLNGEMEMAVPFSFNLLVKKILLLPNPNSALVTLTAPFALKGDTYAPFSQGSLNTGTVPLGPAATPAAPAALVPKTTAKTANDIADEAIKKAESINKKMTHATTFLKSSLDVLTQILPDLTGTG